MEVLAQTVRALRQRRGWTQETLARQAGIGLGTVRDLEQGRTRQPSHAVISRILDTLDVPEPERADLLDAVEGDEPALPTATARRIQVLGDLAVYRGRHNVTPSAGKPLATLGLLALVPNQVVHRETLIDLLWPDNPPETAVGLVHTYISKVRRLLTPSSDAHGQPEGEPDILATHGRGYELVVTSRELDLLSFRELVSEARRQRQAGSSERALQCFESALVLWRSELLGNVTALRGHPLLIGARQELQAATLELASLAESLRLSELAVPHLIRLTREDPLHEPAHASLMVALASCGRQAAAIMAYDDIRRRLGQELGINPGEALVTAYRQVTAGRPVEQPLAVQMPVHVQRGVPAETGEFVGREAEIHLLVDLAEAGGPAVVIAAVEGMAGVGKTRLAIRVAHRLTGRGDYLDLQLYADLHGFSPERAPVDAGVVLESFLLALGVVGADIPLATHDRVTLYRTLTGARPALIILDNAAHEDQVMPLLPAGAGSLVIVTSRRTLAVDGAHPVQLGLLGIDEAVDLMSRLAGADRVKADLPASREVVEACGRLPLAVTLAGKRLASRPAWNVGQLRERLADEDRKLAVLAIGNRDLRSTFELSYRDLGPELRHLLHLLAEHPAPSLTASCAAALADVRQTRAEEMLEQLLDEHLLLARGADRYGLHELVRSFAHGRAGQAETPAALGEAFERVAIWYLLSCLNADEALVPGPRHLRREDVHWSASVDSRLPTMHFAATEQALSWLDEERAALVLVAERASLTGRHRLAWQLAASQWNYLNLRRTWHEWLTVNSVALRSAQAVKDVAGEAAVLRNLGALFGRQGRYDEAIRHLRLALAVRRREPDLKAECEIFSMLGSVYAMQGLPDEAAECFEQTSALSARVGDRFLEAHTLHNLGAFMATFDRNEAAEEYFRDALGLWRQIGHSYGEALTAVSLGEVLVRRGLATEAIEHLHRAHAIAGESANEHVLGVTESWLCRAYLGVGQRPRAVLSGQQAVRRLRAIGAEEELASAIEALAEAENGDRPDV